MLLVPVITEFSKLLFSTTSTHYDEDSQIDSFIFYLRHKYECQRFSILGYHNGGHWYTGQSINKFTIKHESTDSDTPALISTLQAVTTTALKEQPSILKRDHILFEPDIITKPRHVTPAYYENMKTYEFKSMIGIAVLKKVFKLKSFKYEDEMIMSIHLQWNNADYTQQLIDRLDTRVEFVNDMAMLQDLICKSRVRTCNIELLNMTLSQYRA